MIKFKVILIERRQNKGSIIHGKVGRVIKQNNVTIHKGRVKIWSNTESTCPSLRTGNIFLIGGYENALRRKLLLTSKSLIESWNEETMRKIRKWQKGERNVLTKIQGRRWVFSWKNKWSNLVCKVQCTMLQSKVRQCAILIRNLWSSFLCSAHYTFLPPRKDIRIIWRTPIVTFHFRDRRGAAPLHSVTEIAPKSPSLCHNRSIIR